MDHEKILPSTETIRRFYERSIALYEHLQANKTLTRRYKKKNAPSQQRDISNYQVNEAAPTDLYFKTILTELMASAAPDPDILAKMQR